MLRFIVLVTVVSRVVGFGHGDLLKHYAYEKILSSCMGEDIVADWKMSMKMACEKCRDNEVTTKNDIDLQDILNEVLQTTPLNRPTYVPVPVYQPFFAPQTSPNQFSQFGPSNQFGPSGPQFGPSGPQFGPLSSQFGPSNPFSQASQFGQASQFPQVPQHQHPYFSNQLHQMQHEMMGHYIKKRSLDFSPENVKEMKEKILSKLSNMTCVLKEMKLVNEDNTPDYEYVKEEIMRLPIEDGIKSGLMEASEECRDFSLCLPVEKAKNPIKKELGTVIAYMKCMSTKKVFVCLKHDLRKAAASGMGTTLMPGTMTESLTSEDNSPDGLMNEMGKIMFGGDEEYPM